MAPTAADPAAAAAHAATWPATSALQLVSPDYLDFVMVIVNGLDDPERLPLRVQLLNGEGTVLRAGQITALNTNGGAELYHQFKTQDLAGFTRVRVLDDQGQVVLAGTVDQS